MTTLSTHPARKAAIAIALGFAVLSGTAAPVLAQERERGGSHGAAIEAQREPRGYTRLERPPGAEMRPHELNRADFNHNFRASRTYRIGPYHAPEGWRYQRWAYGEILPGPFWAAQYLLQDYWLFGLDTPPEGYDWVRYANDAILVDTRTGEIMEVVYDDFG